MNESIESVEDRINKLYVGIQIGRGIGVVTAITGFGLMAFAPEFLREHYYICALGIPLSLVGMMSFHITLPEYKNNKNYIKE